MSDYGVVKIKIKRPGASVPLKEKNIIGSAQTARNAEDRTVTECYNFIINTLIVYISKGNLRRTTLSWTIFPSARKLVTESIEQLCYGCVYLSAYSSKLNPINNIDQRVKVNKGEEFLQEEILSFRIRDACNRNPFERVSKSLQIPSY
jgi:hypothetical protein